jgi:tetratricopeptide (TPR) repeat protein
MDIEKQKSDVIKKVDILIDLNRFEQAEELCKRHLYLFENDYIIYESLARIYLCKNDFDAMLSCCERALNLSPETNFLTFLLGVCYYWKKEYAISEKHISAALSKDPEYHRCHFFIARIKFYQCKEEEALERIDIALNMSPDNAEYLNLKRKILMDLGRSEEAAELINLIIQINPEDVDVLNEKAKLHIEGGELKKAEFILNNTLQLNPKKKETKKLLFEIHEKKHENFLGIVFLMMIISALYLIKLAFSDYSLIHGFGAISFSIFYFFFLFATLHEITGFNLFKKNKFLAMELLQYNSKNAIIVVVLTIITYSFDIAYFFTDNTYFFSLPFVLVFMGTLFFVEKKVEVYVYRSIFILIGIGICYYSYQVSTIFNIPLIMYALLSTMGLLHDYPDYV